MKTKTLSLMTLFITTVATLFFVSSCEHTLIYDLPIVPPYDTTDPPIDTFSCDTCASGIVSFSEDVLPILQSNCAKSGCHDAASHEEGIVTTSYQTLINTTSVETSFLSSGFWESINDNSMPPYPNPDLTPQQKDLIKRWIQQGAKNTTCKHTCACDSTNATFAAVINPLIQTYCLGCHNSSGPQGGVNLSGYGNVLTYVNNGKLMKSIKHEPGAVAMPSGTAKLNDCTIGKFQHWVSTGAQNN